MHGAHPVSAANRLTDPGNPHCPGNSVRVSRANNTETDLKKDETVDIQVNDLIVAPEGGHGLVRFGDRLAVDILQSSDFSLSDVKLEPGGALFVKLKQVKGHTRVSLSENANARVRLDTDFGSITTLRPEQNSS